MGDCSRFRCPGCAGCCPDDPLPGESALQRRQREDVSTRSAGKSSLRAKMVDVVRVRPESGGDQ